MDGECKFEHTDRTGLYIMVILILWNVMWMYAIVTRTDRKIDRIVTALEAE